MKFRAHNFVNYRCNTLYKLHEPYAIMPPVKHTSVMFILNDTFRCNILVHTPGDHLYFLHLINWRNYTTNYTRVFHLCGLCSQTGVTCFQHGVFTTDEDHYFIEHIVNTSPSEGGHYHIVYKKSAIKSKHTESHCGVEGTYGTIKNNFVCVVKSHYSSLLLSPPNATTLAVFCIIARSCGSEHFRWLW